MGRRAVAARISSRPLALPRRRTGRGVHRRRRPTSGWAPEEQTGVCVCVRGRGLCSQKCRCAQGAGSTDAGAGCGADGRPDVVPGLNSTAATSSNKHRILVRFPSLADALLEGRLFALLDFRFSPFLTKHFYKLQMAVRSLVLGCFDTTRAHTAEHTPPTTRHYRFIHNGQLTLPPYDTLDHVVPFS